MPQWLHILASASLIIGGISAVVILVDLLLGHRQHMFIMNVVWPVTALYSGPIAVWAYYRFGRLSTRQRVMAAKAHGEENPGKKKPSWAIYGVAATHCGAGCTLGDIVAEWAVFLFPVILTYLGYRTLWDEKLFSTWIVDYVLAFSFGIAFQYFTIVPMRHLSPGKGLVQALKADTLSLTAWQVGMYGWMAIATFLIFGHEIHKTSPVFWFMMQIAMLAGFLTSYPVNVMLVRKGVKERM